MTFLRMPPPRGPILVPLSSRKAFTAGVALWSACRRRALVGQRLLWLAGGYLSPRILPGRRWDWIWPLEEDARRSHESAWRGWFSRFDSLCVYRPAQAERRGFAALLMLSGEAVGFVKVRPEWNFAAEYAMHAAATVAKTFYTPAPRGVHGAGGWSSFGMDALAPRIHTPYVRNRIEVIAEEISAMASGFLPPSDGMVPMHGDLGPWNLRHMPGYKPIVFDWEHLALAPRGADVVFHGVASMAMGLRSTVDLEEYPAAVEYWKVEIPRRFGASHRDVRLAHSMLELLSERAGP